MFTTGNSDPIQAMLSQLMAGGGGKSNLSLGGMGSPLQMPGASSGGKGSPGMSGGSGGGMFPGMPGGSSGFNPLSFLPGIGGIF